MHIRGMPIFGVRITGPQTDEGFMRTFRLTVCKTVDTQCEAKHGPEYKRLAIEVDSKPLPSITVALPKKQNPRNNKHP